MFCKICGTEIPPGSTTCSNCGIESDQNQPNLPTYAVCKVCGEKFSSTLTACPTCGSESDQRQRKLPKVPNSNSGTNIVKDFFSFILNCIRSPFSSIQYAKDNFSDKTTYIFTGVFLLLIPIITTLIFTLFVSSIENDLTALTNFQSNSFYDYNSSGVTEIFSTLFPIGKVFLFSLLTFAIPYGLFTLIIVLIYKNICKCNYSMNDYFNVTLVSLSIALVFTVISSLLLFISSDISFFVNVVGSIISFSIMFTGFKDMSSNKNSFFYIFAIVFVSVIFLLSFLLFRLIFSHIIESFMGFNSFF